MTHSGRVCFLGKHVSRLKIRSVELKTWEQASSAKSSSAPGVIQQSPQTSCCHCSTSHNTTGHRDTESLAQSVRKARMGARPLECSGLSETPHR